MIALAAQYSAANYTVVKASALPLVLAAASLLASVALYLFRFQLANEAIFYVGYLLTPVGVIAAMGWDFRAQRVGQQKYTSFDIRPSYAKIIRILAVAGFVVGAFHMLEIGRQIGQLVVQATS